MYRQSRVYSANVRSPTVPTREKEVASDVHRSEVRFAPVAYQDAEWKLAELR
jgi:hypothetical protein